MRCDEMISSRHRSDRQVDILVGLVGHDGWKMNLWTQKSGQTPAGWTGKVLPAATAYYIREVQEEVLAFCRGRGLVTSRLQLDRRGRRHCRNLPTADGLHQHKHTPQQFEAEAK